LISDILRRAAARATLNATRIVPMVNGGTRFAADERPSWHALESVEVANRVESEITRGLTPDEAGRRLASVGPNALPQAKRRSLVAVVLGQFRSPLIYLLFVAAGVALALGHTNDAVVIFTVVLLNAVIGAFQEGRAERAVDALRQLATHPARVVRGGQELVIEAREVVPGEILLLEAGDAVAADARLVHAAALQVAEAALTGESVPVAKRVALLPPDTLLADRRNMVYAGTHVTAGRARAVIVATGQDTQIGGIAALAEAAEEPETPLERRVAQFGRTIMVAAGAVFLLVLAIGLARGVPLGQLFMVGISQLVGMIPEGLPVAMTIALAVGVQRMARRKAVVRRLAAVETLGSTTVICSDKTGTLTKNEMTVTALYFPDGRELSATGVGYDSVGEIRDVGRPTDSERDAGLRALLEAAALCNDAHLARSDGPESPWVPIGDPTEVALLTLALKGGIDPGALREQLPRKGELPFDPAAKMMATWHGTPAGDRVILKGAPEIVIADDNFATIVHAVEEGRVVYRNIKKVILYLFSTSMAEVVVLVLALALGYPPPLAAVQILWINLVTEGTITVNLIMEPREGDEMRQRPIAANERLLTRALLARLAFMTPAIATSTLGWFAYRHAQGIPFTLVQTETFTVLAVCQWFNVLNCRSERSSALSFGLLRNPWLIGGLVASNLFQVAVVFFRPLGEVFHTVPINLREVLAIGVVASLVLWVEELRKLVLRRRDARAACATGGELTTA
jgi:magnesium-transporting ATPase (P-type)